MKLLGYSWRSAAIALPIALCAAGFAHGKTFDHGLWNRVLATHVEDGRVDYAAIAADPGDLNTYLRSLADADPKRFEAFGQAERMAFWINAYNAITIARVIENYPIKARLTTRFIFPKNSVRQIGGFWKDAEARVLNEEISLDTIEHEILRKRFDDPRVHFVLVCASVGCPLLESRAFDAQTLDERLEAAASMFIRNPDKVRLDTEKRRLRLSPIFKWYGSDFEASTGATRAAMSYGENSGVVELVLRHLPEEQARFIADSQPPIDYLDYDWSLNEAR